MNTHSAPAPLLKQEEVQLALDRSPPSYAPGDRLEATVHLPSTDEGAIRNAELSVVWYTAGKGDEDLHVHQFQRWVPKEDAASATGQSLMTTLTTELPRSPLSYGGVIVKVCWCVRVRLFLVTGKQLLVEAPFQLGAVRAAAQESTFTK